MHNSSRGIDFFNGKTEVTKRCKYVDCKHVLKAIISYESPFNDNKMIILMKITRQDSLQWQDWSDKKMLICWLQTWFESNYPTQIPL